jgi:hypothetical protein
VELSRRGFLKIGLVAAAAGREMDFASIAGKAFRASGSSSPQINVYPELIKSTGRIQTVAGLPDGRLMGWWVEGNREGPEAVYSDDAVRKAMARFSSNNARTWSDPEVLFEFPKAFGSYSEGPWLTDQRGVIHLFGLHYLGCGPGGFDNWASCRAYPYHVTSTDLGKTWSPIRYCHFGHEYTGSTNGAIELKNGRLLLPLSYLSGRMTGKFVANLSLSDDAGKTWRPSRGECVVDTGGHLLESGAAEPICIELSDGRIWMLMRTQSGYQYEAFSSDEGETWTEPTPSRFVSSNSPAAFLRLRDGRIVLFWNNCMGPQHREGIMCSYDRQVLAAAITADEGKTWHGYREIGRIGEGESQISYPFATESADGYILCSGLAGPGYFPEGVIRVRPDWLTESHFVDDFKLGLLHWVTLGCDGVKVVPHPESMSANVLVLRKPKADVPAAASLNFPFGIIGHLELRLRLEPSREFVRQHYYLSLADFFCLPRLPYYAANKWGGWGVFPAEGCFTVRLAPDGRLEIASKKGLFQTDFNSTHVNLLDGRWYTLALDWDCTRLTCSVKVDGRHVADLPQLTTAKGVCYLRLWAAAEISDYSGLMVEYVKCMVDS